MDLLFDACWSDVQAGRQREFVTGNNDADGVYLLQWVKRNVPEQYEYMHKRLIQWGGNTRVRAFQLPGDPWWEDPACYLDDDELGICAADYAADKPEAMDLETRVIRHAG